MPELSRRSLIKSAAVVGGAAAAASVVSGAAKADTAAHGDIRDIKHVMIVMQENRSFDHYFGSLKGVRGFADRATIQLPGGVPVWQQPTTPPGLPVTTTQYPWPLSAGTFSGAQPPDPETGAQNYGGTNHSWESQHGAWYGGYLNAWYYAKGGPTTLGYLSRHDIPFHYALADAYTIGDGYHCSALSATGPNRTYLWSGTINASTQHGSYVAYSGGDELGRFLPWESYTESLQNGGITWKTYQGSDNYGDNGAEYFEAFAVLDPSQGGTAAPGNPLYDRGVAVVPEPYDPNYGNAGNIALAVKNDVLAGTLPQVSFVVSNQRFSEHPDGAPTDGAYFVGQVLQALHADPAVFDSTLVIVNFDENDGQFDHVPPPTPAAGTYDEFYLETSLAPAPLPVGFGFRVPLILISPWTRGGWVTSEVSDHTSVIQFLERWTAAIGTPVRCPNISAWRRSVAGDLTSAFDFANPVYGLPDLPWVTAPVGEPRSYHPVPASNTMPVQEPGSKPARPLPVQPNASLAGVTSASGTVTARLRLSNNAPHVTRASHFSVYNNLLTVAPGVASYPAAFPGQFTVVGSATDVTASTHATFAAGAGPAYDITVVGPNRFLRRFTGDVSKPGATVTVTPHYYNHGGNPKFSLVLVNGAASAVNFTITADNYGPATPVTYHVPAGQSRQHDIDPITSSNGWYDLTVTIDSDSSWSQRFTGHLENGRPSVTG